MKRIVDYQVVASNHGELENMVTDLIAQGWQPLGGVAVIQNHLFAQAMVKYE